MLKSFLREYLQHMRLLNKSHITINKHDIFLRDFIFFLHTKNVTDIHDIRESYIMDYQRYRSHVQNRYNKKDELDTQNRYLGSVKKFFCYLKQEGYLISDVTENIPYIRTPKRLPKPALNYEEFKKFISVINIQTPLGYRDRTIIELFYSSALRRNELRSFLLKSVDYENGFARVIGKGDKERVVPIGKVACQYLENFIKGVRHLFMNASKSEYVFLSKKGHQISKGAINELVSKYALAAKIKKHVTPHTFRRSAATGMIRNKANVMLVRDLLGHDSVEAINQYIDLTIVDLKEAHRKTHPREKNQK